MADALVITDDEMQMLKRMEARLDEHATAQHRAGLPVYRWSDSCDSCKGDRRRLRREMRTS